MRYVTRKLYIGRSRQLDELALECGRLYSETLVNFWRTWRKQNVWLKPKSAKRWFNSHKLHAHTADATVESFFNSLQSWRERRKNDPKAKPPKRRKMHYRIEYKNTAIRLRDGILWLSNGKGNSPTILPWHHPIPRTLVIRWAKERRQYQAIATYEDASLTPAIGDRVAGIDLGEIHMAVSHDGESCHILNGRLLRSKRRYQNKEKAKLSALIDRKKKGSKRRRRLVQSQRRQLAKWQNQIRDIEHKLDDTLQKGYVLV